MIIEKKGTKRKNDKDKKAMHEGGHNEEGRAETREMISEKRKKRRAVTRDERREAREEENKKDNTKGNDQNNKWFQTCLFCMFPRDMRLEPRHNTGISEMQWANVFRSNRFCLKEHS